MKSLLKITGIIIAIAFSLIACDTKPSLQKYFVDSKENDQFMSIDLPASIIQLKDAEVSDDMKNTLKTIKKLNFLALEITDTNKEFFTSEKQKVKQILKNTSYKQLMRMNLGNANIIVNYLGEEDAIDEVILFGADNEKGFAIVRVTGKNMNPSDIIKLAQEIKIDSNSSEFKQFESLLSSLN